MDAINASLREKEEQLQEHRTARRYYWDAMDAIYNDGEEGRRLVIKHFGMWHPPYHDQELSAERLAAGKEAAKTKPCHGLIQEIKDLFARNNGGTSAEADIIDETLTRLLSGKPEASEPNTHVPREMLQGLKPPHECEIIARAPDMAEGRDWWIGRLTKPVFVRGTEESFCLHLKTPLKDVVFLLNEADLGQITTLMGCAQGKPIHDGWVEKMMARAYEAAKDAPSVGAGGQPDNAAGLSSETFLPLSSHAPKSEDDSYAIQKHGATCVKCGAANLDNGECSNPMCSRY